VLILIGLGILQAWRSEDMDGLQKAELKREVIRELRREVHGLTADAISKAVGVPSLKLLRVLEEMQRDNILESRTDTARITTWRMKGL
jgi:predicted ArsR family transcriptional regulator